MYVSTSCLRHGHTLAKIAAYQAAGFDNIELGASEHYIRGITRAFDHDQMDHINFIVHHYFPPSSQPFVVNLASPDSRVLSRSRRQVRRSLRFCAEHHMPLFTVHAGFAIDPDLHMRFDRTTVLSRSYEAAFQTFIESMTMMSDYATSLNIGLAVENNVVAQNNFIDAKEQYILLASANEFLRVWEALAPRDVGILVDLGHLKVSANTLGFDRDQFLHAVEHRVRAFHVHDNNGSLDQHNCVSPDSWATQVVANPAFQEVPITLECMSESISELQQQVALLYAAVDRAARC